MYERTFTADDISVVVTTRGDFLKQIEDSSASGYIGSGLELCCHYAGATGYLLIRSDGADGTVVSSNWPYDLAKSLGKYLLDECLHSGQIAERFVAFEPSFIELGNDFRVPKAYSTNICVLPITRGDSNYILSFLFALNANYSCERLYDVALASAYHLAEFEKDIGFEALHNELTEREMECLSWISKGKTSDEIALIIGISRNTVNNYITSIMNKTATKSRAEAVAEAVRSELI